MEDSMFFDIDGILSDEEAEKFFEEDENEEGNEAVQGAMKKAPDDDAGDGGTDDDDDEKNPAEEDDAPEKVGEEEDETGNDTAGDSGDGSSPTVYSSIAVALKKDGIFPDFDDSELEAVRTPEDFADLFEKAISARVDDTVREVREALKNGVEPGTVVKYRQAIDELDSYTEDAVTAEDEKGENLRRYLIFNDLLKRGYSEEKARRELKKSFDAGTDIEDAKDALESLKTSFAREYKGIQDDAKREAEKAREEMKRQGEKFRKMILDDGITVGDSKLDKATCRKIYDAVAKPVCKEEETGRMLTVVQKFQKEKPLEFLRQIGMWFVLTNGGKDFSAVAKKQLQAERNKGIRELERKINSSSFSGGSLRYDGGKGESGGDDILLSDAWKVS